MTTYTENFHMCVYTRACVCTLNAMDAKHAPYFRPYHVQLILAEELVLVYVLE